jgi:hypothetical protein
VALLSLDADLGSAGGVDGIADPMKTKEEATRGDDSQYGVHLSTARDTMADSHDAKRTTIRDMVRAIQVEMRDTDVTPARARELLIDLTALSGNCSTEHRQAEADYNVVLLRCLDGDEAANRARIRAQTTPEYARMREAKDTLKFCDESIRTLKTVIKSVQAEMQALM